MRTLHAPAIALLIASFSGLARAEGPTVHAAGGLAHAILGPQSSELGTGAAGSASVDVPIAGPFALQAGAGGFELPANTRPADPTLAPRATATGLFGAAGVRVRPFGGLWIDADGGIVQSGSLLRPAFDAHLGYDVQVAEHWAVGPFVGYMQVVQPNDDLRPEDARIVLGGIQVSLGGTTKRVAPPVAAPEPAPAPPPPPAEELADRDGELELESACPAGMHTDANDGCTTSFDIVEDRIVLDDVIHFEFDSARIRPVSRPLVYRLAWFLNHHPEIALVEVDGHCDAQGTEQYNQTLSEARAASTRELLVRFGVDDSRLRTAGFGKSRLKVQTVFADPRNRRVELVIVKKGKS